MKTKNLVHIALIVMAVVLTSCGGKKAPASKFVDIDSPCSGPEYMSNNEYFRAYGFGESPDREIAMKLALTGAIKDDILPLDDVVIYGFKFLDKYYRGRLEERFDIEVDTDNVVQLFDDIGIRRGFLLPGKQIDYDKVCNVFLHEFRHQKFGKVILDRVNELV